MPEWSITGTCADASEMVRFVPQQQAWIVERMGKFHRILEPGLAVLAPIIDKIQYVKSLKEAAIEIPSQSAITADNVTLDLDVSSPFSSITHPGDLSWNKIEDYANHGCAVRVCCISVCLMPTKPVMGLRMLSTQFPNWHRQRCVLKSDS